ncbi:MAG: hypothetical protein JSW07_06390 [bacterium]|nr:MAG: hypothetical protein JSW07_06390 [bacterium]
MESRRKVILSALSGQTWMEGDDQRRRIYLGIVKLYSGVDEKTGLQYLWEAVNDSVHWGCFNVYSFMDAILRLGDKLPKELINKAKVRLASNFIEDKRRSKRAYIIRLV